MDIGNYDRLRTESRQVGGVCRDVTAVVVRYQSLHARTRESPHIYPAVEGHPFHKQSTGSCRYIPWVSVRKQEHPGKIPLEDMVPEGHAQTMTAGGWLIRFSHIPLSPATISQD